MEANIWNEIMKAIATVVLGASCGVLIGILASEVTEWWQARSEAKRRDSDNDTKGDGR